jgi:hypothetical protein
LAVTTVTNRDPCWFACGLKSNASAETSTMSNHAVSKSKLHFN